MPPYVPLEPRYPHQGAAAEEAAADSPQEEGDTDEDVAKAAAQKKKDDAAASAGADAAKHVGGKASLSWWDDAPADTGPDAGAAAAVAAQAAVAAKAAEAAGKVKKWADSQSHGRVVTPQHADWMMKDTTGDSPFQKKWKGDPAFWWKAPA